MRKHTLTTLAVCGLMACSKSSPTTPKTDDAPKTNASSDDDGAAEAAGKGRSRDQRVSDLMAIASKGAPEPADVLWVNERLWGKPIPNTVKSVYAAYDPVTDKVISTAITSNSLVVSDLETGHPIHGDDLESDGQWNVAFTLVNPEKRTFYWITRNTKVMRAWHIDDQRLMAKVEPEQAGGQRGGGPIKYPVFAATFEPTTDRIFVADRGTREVAVYEHDLTAVGSIGNLSGPTSLATTEAGGEVFVLDVQGRGKGAVLTIDPKSLKATKLFDWSTPTGTNGFREATVGEDGNFLMYSEAVTKLDRKGNTLWTSESAGGLIEEVDDFGDVIVAVVADTMRNEGSPYGKVVFIDNKTGSIIGSVKTGLVGENATFDHKNNRVYVGNSADASLTVVDVDSRKVVGSIDTGNGVGFVAVDEKTGDRYIMNRLGGSAIYKWSEDGALTEMENVPAWPFDIAVDGERRLFIAPAYFDGRVYIWDLDTGKRDSLEFCPAASGDTVGDLAYDPTTGMAAVIYPDSGCIGVVDVPNRKVMWTETVKALGSGSDGGPGKGLVGILGPDIFVVGGSETPRLERRQLKTGKLEDSRTIEAGGRGASFNLNDLLVDEARKRLYIGAYVINPVSLETTATMEQVSRVMYAGADELIVRTNDDQETEAIATVDPQTFALGGRWPLYPGHIMTLQATFDPKTKKLYVGDLSRAFLAVYDWPITAPSVDAPPQSRRGPPGAGMQGGGGRGSKAGGPPGGGRPGGGPRGGPPGRRGGMQGEEDGERPPRPQRQEGQEGQRPPRPERGG